MIIWEFYDGKYNTNDVDDDDDDDDWEVENWDLRVSCQSTY